MQNEVNTKFVFIKSAYFPWGNFAPGETLDLKLPTTKIFAHEFKRLVKRRAFKLSFFEQKSLRRMNLAQLRNYINICRNQYDKPQKVPKEPVVENKPKNKFKSIRDALGHFLNNPSGIKRPVLNSKEPVVEEVPKDVLEDELEVPVNIKHTAQFIPK